MSETYTVVRRFRDHTEKNTVIKTDLTREAAKAHCNDRDSSSRTCTTAEGHALTELYGDWFDTFEEA
jgi:hypothetical protein